MSAPWELCRRREAWLFVDGEIRSFGHSRPGGSTVAVVKQSDAGSLLAAAPDLLEALREGAAECDCESYGLDTSNCWHARARAAIAKAENNNT